MANFFTETDTNKLCQFVEGLSVEELLAINESSVKKIVEEFGNSGKFELIEGIALHDFDWQLKYVSVNHENKVEFTFEVWNLADPSVGFDYYTTSLEVLREPDPAFKEFVTDSRKWRFTVELFTVAECIRHILYQYLNYKFGCYSK